MYNNKKGLNYMPSTTNKTAITVYLLDSDVKILKKAKEWLENRSQVEVGNSQVMRIALREYGKRYFGKGNWNED